jgi:hypothetical protein
MLSFRTLGLQAGEHVRASAFCSRNASRLPVSRFGRMLRMAPLGRAAADPAFDLALMVPYTV